MDPDKETNYIHLSKKMLDNVRLQPGPNYELKFLTCLTAVHEVAHFLLCTGLELKETPAKFMRDHVVFDFGCFIERALLAKLRLITRGILHFGAKKEFPRPWLDSTKSYSSSELGQDHPINLGLTKSYLKKVVHSKKLKAPTDNDIQKLK